MTVEKKYLYEYEKYCEENCKALQSEKYQDVEESSYYWNGNPKVFVPEKTPDLSKPLVVDLFCGLGGLSLGFESAGFEVVLGLDIHVPSVETYRKSHPKAHVILGDIGKVIKNDLLMETVNSIVGSRKVDVLMAGIPCQGFSLANKKRHPLDRRNNLFMLFLEAAKMMKPKYVLVENVEGIKTLDKGSFKQNIVQSLNEEGYQTEYKILNAADYGVPQIRKRIFFIGSVEGYPIIWPQKKFGTPANPYRTVYDAISDLPTIDANQKSGIYTVEPLTTYQILMRKGSDHLNNHVAPKHTENTIRRINNTLPGQPMYEKYRQRVRLCWDKPSPTQVSGGIRPQFQFGHPEQARGLTVRERCRIQSIPDSIYIEGLMVQGRVQTGNAVPPLLAEEVAKTVYLGLNSLTFKKKLSIWGRSNRRKFPWREMYGDPYKTLITEMLLRKTKAENVAKIYSEFFKKFPDIDSTINKKSDLEKMLKPLGLSKIRAEAFFTLAEEIFNKHKGQIPMDIEGLMDLPHVGRYTANAFLLFGFNKRAPIVDVNVQRVLNRVFEIELSGEIHKNDYIWNTFEKIMPAENPREFGLDILDFGAVVCRSSRPSCNKCLLTDICCHYITHTGS